MLSLLDIAGAVVSIDTMDCQKAIAQTIVDAKADYVLALKDNHKGLCEDVSLWLDTETAAGGCHSMKQLIKTMDAWKSAGTV